MDLTGFFFCLKQFLCFLGGKILVYRVYQSIAIDTMYESSLFQRLHSRRRAANAVHTCTHQHISHSTIQLQQLEDTEEYVWIKPLADRLNLYDEVKVTDPDINFTITLYAKEIEYDCIRKKISGIKLSTRIYDDESTVAGYNIMNGALTENKLAKSASDALVNDAVNQVLSIIE